MPTAMQSLHNTSSKAHDDKEPLASYEASLKSLDTEEHIDLYFYRRIGYAWARLADRLGVTPNAITIASIFLGVGAGVMFYFPVMWMNIIGMALLVWANSFDSADGQLARMTGNYSRLGRILDGLSGDLWFAAIYIAICLREIHTSAFFEAHHWAIWVLASVTAVAHAKQAAMADYYRQFHLYFLKGKAGSELESADVLTKKLHSMSYRRHFWAKLTLAFYTNYTRQQEATAPAMQHLRRAIAARWPSGPLPETLRHDFRMASLPLMKYTNILSFNWRTIVLFVSLFACMPWLYFMTELVVGTAILLYMIIRHERICRRFTRLIQDGKY